MNIRVATTKDIPLINELVNRSYRGEESKKGWTTEADLLDGIRSSESELLEMMIQSDAIILLAESDHGMLGCVYLEQQDSALYLGMLTVRPEQQQKGIGKQLMNAAELHARKLGIKKIKMTVITIRHSLIAYYNRNGYYDTSDRKPFPDDFKFGIPKQPLEFMVMAKNLLQ